MPWWICNLLVPITSFKTRNGAADALVIWVLTLPLGDHLETPPPAAAVADANWWPSVADADCAAPAPPATPDPPEPPAPAALATEDTTAVEVLLPVAVPAVVLPTLEALLPLLPALLPPTAWLKFIDEQPRFGVVAVC